MTEGWHRSRAEARARELLRSWLDAEQVAQLDAFGGFAVGDCVLAECSIGYVYRPRVGTAYGWSPYQEFWALPPSDVLLAQALALGSRFGTRKMEVAACKWPRANHYPSLRGGWKVADLLADQLPLPPPSLTLPPLRTLPPLP